MRPTLTRFAFRVASVAEVVRWRARLLEIGADRIEVGGGALLEICARKAKLKQT